MAKSLSPFRVIVDVSSLDIAVPNLPADKKPVIAEAAVARTLESAFGLVAESSLRYHYLSRLESMRDAIATAERVLAKPLTHGYFQCRRYAQPLGDEQFRVEIQGNRATVTFFFAPG